MLRFCPPLWVEKITSGINMAWIFKSLCHLYSTLNYCHLSDTTSVYLQRRDASFVADLNMEKRKDYAGPKGTDSTGAEYCKKCFINSTDTMKEISFSTERSAMKRKTHGKSWVKLCTAKSWPYLKKKKKHANRLLELFGSHKVD